MPRRDTAIACDDYLLNLSIFLGLPVAAFGNRRCKCGKELTPYTGPLHAHRCNHFEKRNRHDIVAAAYDTCLRVLRSSAVIVGEGKEAPAIGTKLVEKWVNGRRELVPREVRPDRILSGMPGDPPALRRIVDFVVSDPSATTFLPRAANTELHAAGVAHDGKLAYYDEPGLLGSLEEVMPVSIEVHGGVHASVREQLWQWALQAAGGEVQCAGQVMGVMQLEMSLGLMRARLWQLKHALEVLSKEESMRMEAVEGELGKMPRRRAVFDAVERPSALAWSASFVRAGGGV